MFNKKNKKGISPLIATVLIIGFTIVIAALVITWGTNLFKKTQESTGQQADINLACTEVQGNLGLTVSKLGGNNLSVTVDNGVRRNINGFVLRVYNASQTSADTIDTDAVDVSSRITPVGYAVNGNSLKTFTVTYNTSVVSTPVKLELRPKIDLSGTTQQCPGQGVSKDL